MSSETNFCNPPHLSITLDDNSENFGYSLQQLFMTLAPFYYILGDKESTFLFSLMRQAVQNKAYKCIITNYKPNEEGKKNIENEKEIIKYETLVRIHGKGSSILIDRKKELEIIKFVSNMHEMGPKLFASFDNGYIAHYIEGMPLPLEEMRNPFTYKKIARKIAQWHKCKVPDNLHYIVYNENKVHKGVWDIVHQWLDLIKKSCIEVSNPLLLKHAEKEIEELEIFGNQHHYDHNIVFSHNDINHSNIIISSTFNSLTPEIEGIYFVDYEFSDYNFRAFDLGNHFCEWAGLNLQYEYYPSNENQCEFLRAYLTEFDGREPRQEQVDELHKECNYFALVSHLLWYLWAVNQKIISDIDFDYEKYGQQRLEEYNKKKMDFLSLSHIA